MTKNKKKYKKPIKIYFKVIFENYCCFSKKAILAILAILITVLNWILLCMKKMAVLSLLYRKGSVH